MNNNEESEIQKWEVGAEYIIPIEGSLAIFAIGYRGVIAWRQKKKELQSENIKNNIKGSETPIKRD